jgi:hypothetical protein
MMDDRIRKLVALIFGLLMLLSVACSDVLDFLAADDPYPPPVATEHAKKLERERGP